MAGSSKKSNSSNDMMHIVAIVLLVLIIGYIIYLIYKTIKGKEMYNKINSIENYVKSITDSKDLKQYTANINTFKTDYNKDFTAFDTKQKSAIAEYNTYKSSIDSFKIDDLNASQQSINDKIATYNTDIQNIKASADITAIKTNLKTLLDVDLTNLRTAATAKKTTAEGYKTQNTGIKKSLSDAMGLAKPVIDDITNVQSLQADFNSGYVAQVIKPVQDSASKASADIKETDQQILKTSKTRLDSSLSSLNASVTQVQQKLDYSDFTTKVTEINTINAKLKENNDAIAKIIADLNTMIGQIDTISTACAKNIEDIPRVQSALDSINGVITNTDSLNSFALSIPEPKVAGYPTA
jgi:hypothetical protein